MYFHICFLVVDGEKASKPAFKCRYCSQSFRKNRVLSPIILHGVEELRYFRVIVNLHIFESAKHLFET